MTSNSINLTKTGCFCCYYFGNSSKWKFVNF